MDQEEDTSGVDDKKREKRDLPDNYQEHAASNMELMDGSLHPADPVKLQEEATLKNSELTKSERLPEICEKKHSDSSLPEVCISKPLKSAELKLEPEKSSISVEASGVSTISADNFINTETERRSEAELCTSDGEKKSSSKLGNQATHSEFDKLKMHPVVTLSKVDIDKMHSKMRSKLHPKRKAKNTCSKNRISPKRSSEKKNLISKKMKNFPRARSQTKAKAKSSAAGPFPLQSIDEEDFVCSVCRICGNESNECTNIFNDRKKYDHIIEKFLPISVDKSDKLPKTVCKNCLSVLIAVSNLSLKCSKNQVQQQPTIKADQNKLKEGNVFVQNADVGKVAATESPKSQDIKCPKPTSHPAVSLPKKLTSLSNATAQSSKKLTLAVTKRLASTSHHQPPSNPANEILPRTSEIEIISSFSLAAQESPATPSNPLPAKIDEKIHKPLFAAKVPLRSRPERKVIPPAKFENFVKSSTPKERNSNPSIVKPATQSTEPIDLNDKINPKKIQYSFDSTTARFEDESPASPKPVRKRIRPPKKKKEVSPAGSNENGVEKTSIKADKKSTNSKIDLPGVQNLAKKTILDSPNECTTIANPNKDDLFLVNDGSTVLVASTASEEIQKALQLTKNFLIVRVLIPSEKIQDKTSTEVGLPLSKDMPGGDTSETGKDLSEKRSPVAQNLKQVVETTVEVFSSKVKNALVPVYFKVLNESYPSEKVKKTIYTTITRTLTKQKKDIMALWETEECELAPSIFKSLSNNFDSSQSLQQCAKCDKKVLRNEILSHVKYNHFVQCGQCKIVRHSSAALQYHNSIIHTSDPKKCAVCKRMYPSWPNNVIHCPHWFRCSFCGQSFLDHNVYIKHEIKHVDSDFQDLLLKLEPTLSNSKDIEKLKSELNNREDDRLLLDYFWDKSDIPLSVTPITGSKIFCIRCFKVYENATVLKHHICTGEDKCLQVSFNVYKCFKCKRRFKAKSTYFVHYRDCVDYSFNVMRALATYSEEIKIECAICSTVHDSVEKFNNHFDLCFKTNIFHCDRCGTKIIIHAKKNHLKSCKGPIINKKKSTLSSPQSDKIQSHSNDPDSVKIIDDALNVAEISDNVDDGFCITNSSSDVQEDKTSPEIVGSKDDKNDKLVKFMDVDKSVTVKAQSSAFEEQPKPSDHSAEGKTAPEDIEMEVDERDDSFKSTPGKKMATAGTPNDSSTKQLELPHDSSKNVEIKASEKENSVKTNEFKEPAIDTVLMDDVEEQVKNLHESKPLVSGKESSLSADVQTSPKLTGTSSEDLSAKSGDNDAPLDESIIDFVGSASSTPLPKKGINAMKSDSNIRTYVHTSSVSTPKPIPPEPVPTGIATTKNTDEQKETTSLLANALTNNDGKTMKKPKPPPLIKKWFTIKIMTAPVDQAESSSKLVETKCAENLDPNAVEFQNLVKEAEKAADAPDGSMSKVLEVSYSVFFTEVSGKLLPHHFTLCTSKLSQATRDKASSIIKSLLRKQRKKILEETSGKQDKPAIGVEAHSEKPTISSDEAILDPIKAICFVNCIHCKERIDRRYLREHVLKTHMVQCQSCLIYLTSPHELLNHLCIVHDMPFTSCLKCWKKFPRDSDSTKCPCEFKCCVCEAPFTNWLEYLDHEMSHFYEMAFTHASETLKDAFIIQKLEKDWQAVRSSTLMYPCRLCGKRYATKTEIEDCEHSYKCVSCKSIFINYPLFVTHGCSLRYKNQRTKGKDKEKALSQNTDFIHICPLCNETFSNATLYGVHYPMCVETSGKPVEGNAAVYSVSCPYCLTDFHSSPLFLRHYYDCRKENAFLCEHCQEYVSNTHKANHMQNCSQEVLCDNCGTTFPNRTRYRFHFRQQRDGSVFCKTLITDDDGNPFESEPDADIVMETIRNGYFNLKSCAYCGKMFDNVRNCIRHTLAVHLDKVKTCPVCKTNLRKSTHALLTHRKIHSTEELVAATVGEPIGAFRCGPCKTFFTSSYHKILHQIYHHERATLKCIHCQKEFLSKVTLDAHQTRCVEPPKKPAKPLPPQAAKFVCQICDTAFDKSQDYVRHKKSHAGRIACDLCDKTFLSKAIMRNHRKQVHFGTPSTCEICGLEFSCVKNLQIHQRNIHVERPPAICETCGKTFRTPKHLRKHMTVHTGERPYKCTHCDRGFRLLANLHQHEIKHHTGGSRPFECAVCKGKFAQLNNLHMHRRQMHPEIHKYQCEKCKFGYNDLRYYTKHIEVCNTKRTSPTVRKRVFISPKTPRISVKHCPYCNEDVPSLRVHLLRRTDQRPYHCQTCPKKFSYLCSLKHHEALHFNTKKFKCKICDKGFLGLKQYSLHLQLKHNDCFPLHCAHCNRGYNDNKYYYRHIEECNEFTTGPHYEANSKKLTPQCTICSKFFMKFNDLRIHAAMVHKSQSHKKYQCQFCDSSYDSNALLIKHSKHHYKDRNHPGMFLCPKCQYQHYDFKAVLNHDCPSSTAPKDSDSSSKSPSKRASSSNFGAPAKRSRSGTVPNPPSVTDFESNMDSEDLDTSDDESDSDTEIVELKKIPEMDDFDEYEQYEVEADLDVTAKKDVKDTPDSEKVEEIEVSPENLIEETVTDNSNFIYHCSFCKSNFDSLVILQDHLMKDHGFDLDNLEFQVL